MVRVSSWPLCRFECPVLSLPKLSMIELAVSGGVSPKLSTSTSLPRTIKCSSFIRET